MTGTADAADTAALEREGRGRSMSRLDTGIPGFDAVSNGGLPKGRVTSIYGGPGAGKTVFAMQVLAHRMRDRDERVIFVSFEQNLANIAADISGFDWKIDTILASHMMIVHSSIRRGDAQSGENGLQTLIADLTTLALETHATTIVLDGIDAQLSELASEELEREALNSLVTWLTNSGLTGIITVKSPNTGHRSIARVEFLEYHTDCVINLDHLIDDGVVSRTIRIVKFRGSGFNADLLPMLMTNTGIKVVGGSNDRLRPIPITGIEPVRLSTGMPALDTLLEGGYLQGSTTLISGAPGTAKSTLSTAFAISAARTGHRCLYVSFDETERQIALHMASVGYLVRPEVEAGNLRLEPRQAHGLPPEVHVANILRTVDEFTADVVIIDPISAIMQKGHPFMMRTTEYLLSELRDRGVTMLCTTLLERTVTGADGDTESTQSKVSTLADTWMHLAYIAIGGERNRTLTIVKSRGTAHSNQVRELKITNTGVTFEPVYSADGEVLLGSARLQKEAALRRNERAAEVEHEAQKLQAEVEVERLSAQLEELNRQLQSKRQEIVVLDQARHLVVEEEVADVNERITGRSMMAESAAHIGAQPPLP